MFTLVVLVLALSAGCASHPDAYTVQLVECPEQPSPEHVCLSTNVFHVMQYKTLIVEGKELSGINEFKDILESRKKGDDVVVFQVVIDSGNALFIDALRSCKAKGIKKVYICPLWDLGDKIPNK